MSATNSTQNYNLPQFVGSDKPTWLGDFNGAMNTIDGQMKANADGVTTAQATANTAQTTSETALSTANEADTNSQEAQSTSTNALSKALEVEAEIAKFNLINIKSIATSDITVTGGKSVDQNNIRVATNSDGSIGKIYGQIGLKGSGTGQVSFQTDLRPSENITIDGAMFRNVTLSNNTHNLSIRSFSVSTTGLVTASYTWVDNSNNYCSLFFIACLLFMKNFGDQPNE